MKTNAKGFTLVELMIAMVIGIIIMGGIVYSYYVQQQTRTTQQLVVEMQQNARSAIALMRRELRMANYNPRLYDGNDNDGANGIDDPGESSVKGLLRVSPGSVQFTLDLNADGDDSDEGECITFQLDPGADVNGDGIADQGASALARESQHGAGFQDLAFDIVAVAFAYAVDQNNDGFLDTYGGGLDDPVIWLQDTDNDGTLETHLDTNQDGVIDTADSAGGRDVRTDNWMTSYPVVKDATQPGASQPVRAVRIWLLARTRAPIRGHQETETFVVGGHHIAPANNHRHFLIASTVKIRNPFQ